VQIQQKLIEAAMIYVLKAIILIFGLELFFDLLSQFLYGL